MQWTKTATLGFPVQREGESDSIPCLTIGDKQIKILCWNVFYACWDDENGDDHYCASHYIDYWMRIADLPNPEASQNG